MAGTTARQRPSGPWASCCTRWSAGSTRSRRAGTSAGASCRCHNGSLKVDAHLCGTGGMAVLGGSSGLTSIPLWQLPRRWPMPRSPALPQNKEWMGKFRHSLEPPWHGLGMATVGQSRQEPSATDRRFLVSPRRLQRADQMVSVPALLGQALIRRPVV